MDINETKQYLGSYKTLNLKIKRLQEMLTADPQNADVYQNEISRCVRKRYRIEEDIDSVDNGILSEILALKYICGKTLEEIALTVGYCKRQTERLHIKAVKKLCIA